MQRCPSVQNDRAGWRLGGSVGPSPFGRVAVRASGSFNIKTASGLRQGIGWKWCTAIQRGDGYGYSTTRAPR